MRAPRTLANAGENPSEADRLKFSTTVHLDPVRYRMLKQFSSEGELSHQDLLIKALDAYLQAHIK